MLIMMYWLFISAKCFFFKFFLQLQGSGPQMFVAWLLDIFEKGNFEDSTESE